MRWRGPAAEGAGETEHRGNRPPPAVPECLDPLRVALGAEHVSLIRFVDDGDVFQVVGSAGVRLLAAGVTLPTEISTIALHASRGRQATVAFEEVGRPLDRMEASLELRHGRGVPLRVADACAGALLVGWANEAAHATSVAESVNGCEVELLHAVLALPDMRRALLVCHEDRLIAEGVGRAVERPLGVAAEVVTCVDEAVKRVRRRRPDVILCSDRLCPEIPLHQVGRRLRASGAAAPLLVLARADSARSLRAAVESGATGYVPLMAAEERLVAAVTALLEGRSALPSMNDLGTGPDVTDREYEVLQALERGLSDKEIALELGVAVSTVKTHVRAVYAKLDATSRMSALHEARALGLI